MDQLESNILEQDAHSHKPAWPFIRADELVLALAGVKVLLTTFVAVRKAWVAMAPFNTGPPELNACSLKSSQKILSTVIHQSNFPT
jgi:hypothetical protein